MNYKKQFTTVTLFSKLVALALFVALPFIGFYFGVMYAEALQPATIVVVPGHQLPTKPLPR